MAIERYSKTLRKGLLLLGALASLAILIPAAHAGSFYKAHKSHHYAANPLNNEDQTMMMGQSNDGEEINTTGATTHLEAHKTPSTVSNDKLHVKRHRAKKKARTLASYAYNQNSAIPVNTFNKEDQDPLAKPSNVIVEEVPEEEVNDFNPGAYNKNSAIPVNTFNQEDQDPFTEPSSVIGEEVAADLINPDKECEIETDKILVRRTNNGISVAYVTKENSKLLLQHEAPDVKADYVLLSSETYEDVKPHINAKFLAVCRDEKELHNIVQGMYRYNKMLESRGLLKYIEGNDRIFNIDVFQQIFRENAVHRVYEQILASAIPPKTSLTSRIKSLFTRKGIVDASKYALSKIRDITSWTAKSVITAPVVLPCIGLWYLVNKNIYAPAFITLMHNLAGTRPDTLAINLLLLAPTAFFANLIPEAMKYVLNKLGRISFFVPFTALMYYFPGIKQYMSGRNLFLLSTAAFFLKFTPTAGSIIFDIMRGASYFTTSILVSISSNFIALLLSRNIIGLGYGLLSNFKPFVYMVDNAKNLVDKHYPQEPIELISRPENTRRESAAFDNLQKAAEGSKNLAMPYSLQESSGELALKDFNDFEIKKEIMDKERGISELLERFKTKIKESPETLKLAVDKFLPGSKLGDLNDLSKQAIVELASMFYWRDMMIMLDDFEKKNAFDGTDRGLELQKAKLKRSLRNLVEESKAARITHKGMSPKKIQSDTLRYRKSIDTLELILITESNKDDATSNEIANAIYSAHQQIHSILGNDSENDKRRLRKLSKTALPELQEDLANKLRLFYSSHGQKMSDDEIRKNTRYLLSLKLPIDSHINFQKAAIEKYIIPLNNRIKSMQSDLYSRLITRCLSLMDDTTIDLIVDWQYTSTPRLDAKNPTALIRVLHNVLHDNDVSYVSKGFVKIDGKVVPIDDFVNHILRPRRDALLSALDEDEGVALNMILRLFDEKNKDDEALNKIKDKILLLCDAHAAKPNQSILQKMLSHISSYINYGNTSGLSMMALTMLLATPSIYSTTSMLGTLFMYYMMDSNKSKSEAFLNILLSCNLNYIIKRIPGLGGLTDPVSDTSNSFALITLSSYLASWLTNKVKNLLEFNDKVSEHSFMEILDTIDEVESGDLTSAKQPA